MKCKYCNTEIEQDALFCPNCGKDLSKFDKCVKCGELLDQDAAFCPHCGTEQPHEEVGEESSSKKWIWILCTVLGIVLIVGGIFFFSSNKSNFLNVNGTGELNTDSAQMVEAISKRVTEIYSDVFSCNGEDYDSKYCSKSFLALVKEFDEAYEKANTDELIGPDRGHWTMEQDARVSSMKVISISKLSDREAMAKIHIDIDFGDNSGNYNGHDVGLKLIYENGNWFIDDFICGDYSERDVYQGGIETCKEIIQQSLHSEDNTNENWRLLSQDFDRGIKFKKVRVKAEKQEEWAYVCVIFSTRPNVPNSNEPYAINLYSWKIMDNAEELSDKAIKFTSCKDVGNGWYEYEFSRDLYFSKGQVNARYDKVQVCIEN